MVEPVDPGAKVVHAGGLKRIDPALARSCSRTTLEGNELLICGRATIDPVVSPIPRRLRQSLGFVYTNR